MKSFSGVIKGLGSSFTVPLNILADFSAVHSDERGNEKDRFLQRLNAVEDEMQDVRESARIFKH
jgi:hypothetical protein